MPLANSTLAPPAAQQVAPGAYRQLVALNIQETRTRNYVRELERRGYQCVSLEVLSWAAALRALPFLVALLRSSWVLCGSAVPFQIPWMLLAKLFGRRVVVDFPMDITEWPFLTLPRWRWMVTRALRLADGVLTLRSREYVVAKFALDPRRVRFVESCPDPARVSRTGCGKPRFQPRPGAFLICWSGGHPHHRLDRFAPIFEALLPLVPNAELLVVADPMQPSVLETQRQAEKGGWAERVHTIPVIHPAEDFYETVAQCDLWVATLGDDTLQGRQEFRMELMEIGLLGKAVIAVPTPGLATHSLTDGQEIIFVEPSDPGASALKLAAFARSPETLSRIGQRWKARVLEQFSLKDAVDEVLDLLPAARSR